MIMVAGPGFSGGEPVAAYNWESSSGGRLKTRGSNPFAPKKDKRRKSPSGVRDSWLRGKDLNLRPLGYENSPKVDSSRKHTAIRNKSKPSGRRFPAAVDAESPDFSPTARRGNTAEPGGIGRPKSRRSRCLEPDRAALSLALRAFHRRLFPQSPHIDSAPARTGSPIPPEVMETLPSRH